MTSTKAALLGDESWEKALSRLHGALQRSGYRAITWIPTERNLLALPLEPLNVDSLLHRRRRRLLEWSAFPDLYWRIADRVQPGLRQRLMLFFLCRALPSDVVRRAIELLPDGPSLDELVSVGILRSDSIGSLRCAHRFIPINDLLLVTDPFDRSIPDFAYLGRDSLMMAEFLATEIRGRRFDRALDLCCGTGVQALMAAHAAGEVEGTEINPRAVAYAQLNARLAGLESRVRIRQADLTDGVRGPFDLVVSNPPFVWIPEEERGTNRDGFGGRFGLELVDRILQALDRLLGPGGEAYVILESPVINGELVLRALTEQAIGGAGIAVELLPLLYRVNRRFAGFQRRHGVSHTVSFFLRAHRAARPSVTVRAMPMAKRAVYSSYCWVASAVYRWSRSA